MDASAILAVLRTRGATLTTDGANITVRPRSVLTDADREAIRGAKTDIIRLLAGPDVLGFLRGVRDRGVSLICYPDGDLWWTRGGLTPGEVAFIAEYRVAILAVLEREFGGGFVGVAARRRGEAGRAEGGP